MKLIAHEAPISILEQIRKVTNYDYCLVHLLENQEYFNFFKRSLEVGRSVILDNSIFELGKAFDHNRYVYWINRLKPTEYIIPDVLEDCKGTVDSLLSWVQNYSEHVIGPRIGVVQGKSYNEIVDCYVMIKPYCDKIAISFNYSLYEELFPGPNKFVSWMLGRVLLISRLLRDKIIDERKPHHLLGIALPQEMIFYRDKKFDFIETVDTSNPVIHGIMRERYSKEGLWSKCMTPCNDLINHKVTDQELEDILFNISQFKSFVNG